MEKSSGGGLGLEYLFDNYNYVFWDSSGFIDGLPRYKEERQGRRVDMRDQKAFVDEFVESYLYSKRFPFYITDKVRKEMDPNFFNPDEKPTKEAHFLDNAWRVKLLKFFKDMNRILSLENFPSKLKQAYVYFYNDFYDLAKERGLDYKLDSNGNGNKSGLGTDKDLAFVALAYSFEKDEKTSLITNDKAIWKFLGDVNYHEEFSHVDVYGRVGKEIFKKFV